MSDDVLRIEGMTAGYAGVPVIRDLSFAVPAGRIIALLGPNGAGKTTTLLAISGILRPDAGTVTLNGEPIQSRRPEQIARAGLSLVPDDRGVFAGLTVAENLRLGRRKGSAVSEDDVLDRFPRLRDLRDRRAGVLSGGEQQMLAIAKAFVGGPSMLLIDELSLGLAPLIVASIFEGVRDLASELGTAVLLVEQHVEMALGAADRAVVLNHGRVVLAEAASQLRERRELLESAYFGEEAIDDAVA